MCKIGKKTKLTTAIGYKAVLKIDGKYYSPSTGLQYKIGMELPNLKRLYSNASKQWSNPLTKHSRWYEPRMQGKTGAFKKLDHCVNSFKLNEQYHILKITLGGEIYNGSFLNHRTFIGTMIIDFVELEIKTKSKRK